jgi:hypothetical protein
VRNDGKGELELSAVELGHMSPAGWALWVFDPAPPAPGQAPLAPALPLLLPPGTSQPLIVCFVMPALLQSRPDQLVRRCPLPPLPRRGSDGRPCRARLSTLPACLPR